MDAFFTNAGKLIGETLQAVYTSVIHNWRILALATLIATALKTYVNGDKLSGLLMRKRKISIIASVIFGAFTPFCACGTSAVVLGMLTTTLPWGPIMAFLTSSPLMSPDGFVFISGIISTGFAIALTVASLGIGLSSGFLTNLVERRTHILENQSRFLEKAGLERGANNSSHGKCGCGGTETIKSGCCTVLQDDNTGMRTAAIGELSEAALDSCCANVTVRGQFTLRSLLVKYRIKEFMLGLYELGIKSMLLSFSIFIAIGYLINSFIPDSMISALFGANAFYAVPLASLIGLPLYLTTASGMPIIQSMMASGASEGAMLAFIITGSATSAWVIAGLSTFLKKKAILLYVLFILAGGMISGYLYDLFLALI